MFKDKLKTLRKNNNMTQAQLGEKLNLDTSSITKYETGGSLPSIDIIKKISKIFNISIDYLLENEIDSNVKDVNNFTRVSVIGTVKAGVDGIATYEYLGEEKAVNINGELDDYKYLRVRGESMAPQIQENDLALVRLQPDVESGDLAVVIIDSEEGVIKKIQKGKNSISLISFNQNYETRVFVGNEMERISIFGKVIKIERMY